MNTVQQGTQAYRHCPRRVDNKHMGTRCKKLRPGTLGVRELSSCIILFGPPKQNTTQ